MFEKVNPCHPDKVADRIAGAIVDLCYTKSHDPKVACEVLIGHGEAGIQVETSEQITAEDIEAIVSRIAGEGIETRALIVPQDPILSHNQDNGMRVADNGLFRGVPPTHEQKLLTAIAASIYERWPYDGKYIVNYHKSQRHTHCPTLPWLYSHQYDFTICQSNAKTMDLSDWLIDFTTKKWKFPHSELDSINFSHRINPLGEWTGGPNTDSGATNRKLGSDMGDGVTGGGLHGKDLSKGDVSINTVCFLKAVQSGQTVTACCSIGDESVTFTYASGKTETETFADVVEMARLYILTDCGGSFERFSEWGLLRPLAQVKSEE